MPWRACINTKYTGPTKVKYKQYINPWKECILKFARELVFLTSNS